ncbi:hypothetical protein ACFCW2_03760 [Qipengyuania sp. DSG2-2]|uniref:hypothetical protein n=1 Tax=Qipengyuania sp. DGS2-2 TaxID=3349631 RepID=UPI0036D41FF2
MSTVQTDEERELEQLRGRLKHSDRLPSLPKKGKRLEWRFDAYKDLLQRLGHGDGMAEVIEVARRDFVDLANASGDPRGYLRARAKAQNIVVDELDAANLPTRAAILYIVGAYQQLEGFLKELVDEVDETCSRNSRDRRDKEAALDWALDVLPGGATRNTRRIWQERYEVLEYYRTVRNAFTHKVKQGTLDAAFSRAEAWRPIIDADLRLSAPNPFDSLSFDDFLLFTRMIKYVATDLCRLARPTRAEIAEHAERVLDGPGKFRHWNWETVSRERAVASIATHYSRRHLFDFCSEPQLLDEIVDQQFSKFDRQA